MRRAIYSVCRVNTNLERIIVVHKNVVKLEVVQLEIRCRWHFQPLQKGMY